MNLTERGLYQALRDWNDGAVNTAARQRGNAFSRAYRAQDRDLREHAREMGIPREPLRRPDRLDPEPSEPDREEFP